MTGPNSRRVTLSHDQLVEANKRLVAGETLKELAGCMGLSAFCLRSRLIDAGMYPDFSAEPTTGYRCGQCRRVGEKAEGTALCTRCAPKHTKLKPGTASRNESSNYKGHDPISQKFLMNMRPTIGSNDWRRSRA